MNFIKCLSILFCSFLFVNVIAQSPKTGFRTCGKKEPLRMLCSLYSSTCPPAASVYAVLLVFNALRRERCLSLAAWCLRALLSRSLRATAAAATSGSRKTREATTLSSDATSRESTRPIAGVSGGAATR